MSAIDMSKKYRTRDGREARIYAIDGNAEFPVHGAILRGPDGWCSTSWGRAGSSMSYGTCGDDLIEIKPRIKRTVWLNVYPGYTGDSFRTKESADAAHARDRIACIKVEIDCEEGEGL